jgi:DNA primase
MSSKKHLTDFISQCHTILLNGTDEGVAAAVEYLHKERGLTEQSIKEHQIGYCPRYYNLPDEIRFYGATDEAEKDDENAKDFSYFICDRIIVPIYEEFGVVEAFATRKASSEKGNTWWNLSSPFKKGNHLFLLNKVRKNVFLENKIYLVEGYMDALLLYQKGLNKVCSLMGTHLTPRKIGLIARYCNHICL